MLDTKETLAANLPATRSAAWNIPVAVALVSFSALLLELGLTRLFSVVLFDHFAFLAISIALLGLGAGASVHHPHGGFGYGAGDSAIGQRVNVPGR